MKKTKNNGIRYVAISLALIVAIGVSTAISVNANQSLKQLLADALAQIVGPQIITDLGLGEEDITVGAMPGTDIDYPIRFHEGLYPTIYETGIFKASTTRNALASGDVKDVAASFYATRDLVCNETWVDLVTAPSAASVGYSFWVGTTTKTSGGSWTNTSTATILASTTVATTAATSKTAGMFTYSSANTPGSAFDLTDATSSVTYLVNAGEYVVFGYASNNATSVATFANSTLKAKLNANCWAR